MIANESASISRSSAFTQAEVRDSELICMNCKTIGAVDDLFCQECGATLIEARDYEDAEENGSISTIDKLLMLRDFDYPALVKRFVILIAVVVVSGLSVLTVLAISASYDAMSEDYICDHAKKLLGENDPLEATEILQRLYFARGQKLKPQTLDLLAQALVNRSDLYVGRNKIEAAIKDLKDIPPDTALALIAAQKLRSLIPKAVPPATLAETIKPVVAESVVAKAKEVNAPAQVLAAKPVAQLPKPAFAADDVTNYNRLLAAYFEKTGVESEQPADSGSSDEASKSAKPVSEPPTLKEWVNAGRPDF